MKKLKYIYWLVLFPLFCITRVKAQQKIDFADTVKKYRQLYLLAETDSNLFKYYDVLSSNYQRSNPDSGLYYGHLALKLAKKSNKKLWETIALGDIEFCLRETGSLAEALNMQLQTLELSKQLKNKKLEGLALNSIGNTYLDMGTPRTALNYYQASFAVFQKLNNHYWIVNETSNTGNAYEKLDMPDSALFYEERLHNDKKVPGGLFPELMARLGNANAKLGKYKEALNYYRQGLVAAVPVKTVSDMAIIYYQMAKMYDDKLNRTDSGVYYAHKALAVAKSIALRNIILSSAQLLADLYGRHANIDSAYHYQQIAMRFNDTLFGAEKFGRIQRVLSDEQQRQQKLLLEQETLKQRYQLIGAITVILFVVLITIMVWRNNLTQRKKNRLLDIQKNMLTGQRDELQTTLAHLNTTQTQLIQAEKMASLGELTAGIAHEIQNPLNFVNNFSEVNQEMLEELKAESEKPKAERDEQAEAELINDLIENEKKINHHGKRADFIVKGMLQHSRTSTGKRELTNINVLAEEFFKLSYRGLRAKDKSFNAVPIAIGMITHFDPGLPKINVVSQDIGRALLNLFNNAFYAVNQKAKTAGMDYKPEVSVTTAPQPPPAGGGAKAILIIVRDNGIGIPDAIKEKIMQPFFTTKPTGEGTGLGLSLTYDMVVKGHGGKIEVNTKEGEFTEFIVTLPL